MPGRDSSIPLRAAAGVLTSFRQQFWMLGRSRRWLYMAASLLVVIPLVGSVGFGAHPHTFVVAAYFAILAGALWPLGVWAGEQPARRGYHWSLPVSRPAHDLARIAAGAVHLVGACTILAAVIVLFAAADGTFPSLAASPAIAWANFFLAPLIAYLLASPIILWSEYAVTRWIIGTLIFFGVTGMLLQGVFLFPLEAVLWPVFLHPTLGLTYALTGMADQAFTDAMARTSAPAPGGWWRAVAFWLLVAAVVNSLAARYRPDDLARLIGGRSRDPHLTGTP